MGIFDSVKKAAASVGMYEDAKPVSSNSIPSNSTPRNTVVNTPAPTTFYVPVPTIAAVGGPIAPVLADSEMVQVLTAALGNSTVPGYDQFKVILDTMSALPEPQRYPMALNVTAASSKLTPDNIVASLDDRLAILDGQANDFSKMYETEIDKQVTQPTAQAQQIADAIAAKQQEIQELEAQRVATLSAVNQSQTNLDRERATFAASLNVVRTSVTAERQKIAAFIVPQTQPTK